LEGGNRYRLRNDNDKEFTDIICETVKDFCGGQILKHVGELINSNPKPEVGFFKIAVWAFIWWIKEQENLTQRDKGEEFDNVKNLVVGDCATRCPDFVDSEPMVRQGCQSGQDMERNSGGSG